jgi:threonine dehydratase
VAVNFTDIEEAHRRIAHLIAKTPLLNSPRLDAIAGRRLWLKAEPLQITGSFKFRGACSAISTLSDEARSRGVIAYSSGNHAQGIALAATLFQDPRHHRHAARCASEQGRQHTCLRR